MAVLPLLADPASYRACEWELTHDAEGRAYWLGLFRNHIHSITDRIVADHGPAVRPKVEAFLAEYLDGLAILDENPAAWGELTVLRLTLYRQELLQRHGFLDPFARVKRVETDAAVELYAPFLRSLNPLAPRDRWETLARAIFAGNEFDLGSTATTEKYRNGGHDFAETMASLPARPWPEDDLDAWCDRMRSRRPPYRKAIFFVDNAGADVVLGCLPFARELAMYGTRVILAANTGPALNDITRGELDRVLDVLRGKDSALDDALREGKLATVASGCATPLIDLSEVSEECAEAARDCDLIILEGMGRSVEANRTCRFTCDSLRAALVKDPFVADHVGAPMFAPLFRYVRS